MAERTIIQHYYTTGETAPSATNLTIGEIAVGAGTGTTGTHLYTKDKNGTVQVFDTSAQTKTKIDNAINALDSTVSAASGYYITAVTQTNGKLTNVGTKQFPTVTNTVQSATTSGTYYLLGSNSTATTTGITYKNSKVYISGDTLNAGGFYETSDERLKDFSDEIEVDFEKLSKLRKAYFTFKDDKAKITHLGLSAQEVKELYPEIVNLNMNGYLSVDYSKLSVIALKAIDVMYEKQQNLEKRIEEIEKKLF